MSKEEKQDLAYGLRSAWRRYVDLFGVPPHGTINQLIALVELMPSRATSAKKEG